MRYNLTGAFLLMNSIFYWHIQSPDLTPYRNELPFSQVTFTWLLSALGRPLVGMLEIQTEHSRPVNRAAWTYLGTG